MILLAEFLGSGNYSIVGPYMGEMCRLRLRGSGMGLVYGVGNLGNSSARSGWRWIAGSDNFRQSEGDAGRAVSGGSPYFAYCN